MKRQILCAVVAVMFAVASGLSVALANTPALNASLCSLVPWPMARSADGTFFVGTSMRDTIESGLGEVRTSIYTGHSGSGRARTVYGQLIRIDTIGGADSVLLSSREALVVPWDYDAACQVTYWTRSARWVEPGQTGFFMVRARPRANWINGRPTFDAFQASLKPYPQGAFFKAGFRGTYALTSRPSLTALEMFSLYKSLPETGSYEGDPLKAIRTWVSEHPDLAAKYPADWILERVLGKNNK